MVSRAEDRPVEMTPAAKENSPCGPEPVNEFVCTTAINRIPTTEYTASWPK